MYDHLRPVLIMRNLIRHSPDLPGFVELELMHSVTAARDRASIEMVLSKFVFRYTGIYVCGKVGHQSLNRGR